MIMKLMSHRGQDLVRSNAKNLKQLPYAISKHFPVSVRESRSAKIPLLIEKEMRQKII